MDQIVNNLINWISKEKNNFQVELKQKFLSVVSQALKGGL